MTPEMGHISENRDFADFGPGIDLLAPRGPFRKPNAHPGPARRLQVTRRAALASRRVILFMGPGGKGVGSLAQTIWALGSPFLRISRDLCVRLGRNLVETQLETGLRFPESLTAGHRQEKKIRQRQGRAG